MTTGEMFYQAHIKHFVVAAIAVMAVTAGQVIYEDTQLSSKTGGVVLGESINNPVTVALTEQKNNLAYQFQIRQIVRTYIEKRSVFKGPHQDWMFDITNAKYQMLNVNVPEAYQDLHVRLVTILDREYAAVEQNNLNELDKLGEDWENIFARFFWLAE